MNDKADQRERAKRILKLAAFPAAFISVVLLHLGLTYYFERPNVILSSRPIDWLDFECHINHIWRVTEALAGWGKNWAYDVQLLAGHPTGVISDVSIKGWELWTFALWKLGLPRGLAFNLFILASELMVPWVVLAAARIFGLDRWASLLAMLLATCLWFFDAYPRWCTWVGMVAYATSGYFFLLPFALMYRYTEQGGWWRGALLGITLAMGPLVHPYIFVALVFPLAALYLRAFSSMGWKRHAGVAFAALSALAVNSYSLLSSARFWHYILDSGFYGQSTSLYLLTDYLGLMKEPMVTGVIGNRTGFRFVAFAAAAMTLAIWWKADDRRFLPFATGLGSMLAMVYLSGYLWLASQIQPYRYILPAMFFAVIPAAEFAVEVWRSGALQRLPRLAYAVAAIALVVAVPQLARDVLYFMPGLLPEARYLPEEQPNVADIFGFSVAGYPKHMEFRHVPTWPDFDQLADWIQKRDDGQGRILVEWWIMAEHLMWRTRSQILGGYIERNLEQVDANIFRRYAHRKVPRQALKTYLQEYAVKWVIVTHPRPDLERAHDLLEPLDFVPPHRIYRSKLGWNFFKEGSGTVKASMNRLQVTGSAPDRDVVLRFHWLETLACRPNCAIRREPMPDDRAGFIRVPAPHPRDFLIYNAY